jgi:hypothetical protein
MVGLMCRVFNRRQNVFAFEVGVVLQYFLVGSSRAKQLQDIRDAHPHAANTRTPAAFSRLDGDTPQQLSIHAWTLIFNRGADKYLYGLLGYNMSLPTELGVEDGTPMLPRNGDDRIQAPDALAPAWFVWARQADMRRARFALVELCARPIPRDWPQFGIELTAGWARRGWQGAIAHTRLLQELPGG